MSAASDPLDSKASAVKSPNQEITETAYFTVLLPTDWQIEEQLPEEGDPDATFEVIGPDAAKVFDVTVATDAPRFLECFCAPWDNYTQYERDGIKYADLTMAIGPKSVRTLKAVGTKYGTDVHLIYERYDPKLLDELVESIRPF